MRFGYTYVHTVALRGRRLRYVAGPPFTGTSYVVSVMEIRFQIQFWDRNFYIHVIPYSGWLEKMIKSTQQVQIGFTLSCASLSELQVGCWPSREFGRRRSKT